MRWLLIKDLQILRRSPLLVGLLIVYPIAIALMIGFALSSPPSKPTVAFYNQVPKNHGTISLGSQKIDVASYARDLLRSVQPIKVHSQAEAVAAVRDGRALAAVVVPADLPQQIQSLITQGVGSPTVQLYLNSRDPIERDFVNQAISSRVNAVEQAVSKQVLRVAITDLQQVLNGGSVQILGQTVRLLGLRNARTIVQGTLASLPANSALRPALSQVISFANLAIQGLAFAKPVLGTIGTPLTVNETQLDGRTTPTDAYAASIAVIVSLMFVTMLLAAGMLALERTENAYPRLIRGLVTPGRLLSEKVALAAGCATVVTLIMAAFVSLFVHLDWSRLELWVLALALGSVAFGALGVAIGAIAREVSAASLMAFLVSLPIAFVALVPASAVSGALKTVLDVIAFLFPFKAALEAVSNAFTGTSPGIGLPLVHLVVLAVVFGGLATVFMRRFAAH
ncbi:MAG TPA: ABC transporter permease [Solirubrobacteraceae bacterium]|nr:ABC transporter permease [Solirubrobacteraceae bacterium]